MPYTDSEIERLDRETIARGPDYVAEPHDLVGWVGIPAVLGDWSAAPAGEIRSR